MSNYDILILVLILAIVTMVARLLIKRF